MHTQKYQNILHFLAEQLLHLYDINEAKAIVELLLEQLNINKIADANKVDASLYSTQLDLLKQGFPVQQIIGQAFFWDRFYKVSEATLIPRPETEELIFWIKNLKLENVRNIIDIGTGSGCIACTLQLLFPKAKVYAMDICSDALKVAKENASAYKLDIEFIQADILKKNWPSLPKFDIIVSNPPYITEQEKVAMHKNVLEHEPHTALFVTNGDPQQFYKAIGQFAKKHLGPKGNIFLELNKDYGKDTQKLYKSYGYETILKQDMQENDRMLRAFQ